MRERMDLARTGRAVHAPMQERVLKDRPLELSAEYGGVLPKVITGTLKFRYSKLPLNA